MNELYLTIGSILAELGIPIFVLAKLDKPLVKVFGIPVLGSISPLLILYIAFLGQFIFDRSSDSSKFAIAAVWMMSFIPYVACVALGVIVGFFIRKRIGFLFKYLAGLLSGLALMSVFLFI